MKSQLDKVASQESKLIAGITYDERIGFSRGMEVGATRSNAIIADMTAQRQLFSSHKKHSHTESMIKAPAGFSTIVTSGKNQKALDFLEEVGQTAAHRLLSRSGSPSKRKNTKEEFDHKLNDARFAKN